MTRNREKSQDVLDNLMDKLGEFGPYQRWQYCLHVIAALLTGVHMYSLLTVAAIPEHRCEIPNVDINGAMADVDLKTLTRYIPLISENQIDSCMIYNKTTNESVKCSSWVYNSTYHPTSRAIEWNFVCDRRWMGAISQTVFMLGVFLGNIVLGNLSDKVGRKPVYCWTALFSLILGVGVAFTTQYYLFLVIRFILGMVSCAGANMAGFVLTMELVGANRRSAVGVGYQVFFAFGIMVVALWGWIIKDRQLLQITYGLHGLPFIIHWWLMDESPRWLWAKGRYQESLEIIQRALNFNGSSIKLDFDSMIPRVSLVQSTNMKNNSSFSDVFKQPNLRRRMLNIGLCWFANSLVYYGLSLGTGSMKGNPFLIIFIMGLIEIPGYIIVVILIDRLGRRLLTSFNMIVSGFCCVLAVSVSIGSVASTSLVYLGKFLIACSYSVIYIYSAELFPTMTRNSAIGFASMCARVSGSLTPLITLLDSFDPKIPCILFGVITIFSGYLTMFLPETLGTEMPSTIDEGEKFGRGDTIFSNFLGRKQIVHDINKKSTKIVLEQLEPLHGSANY